MARQNLHSSTIKHKKEIIWHKVVDFTIELAFPSSTYLSDPFEECCNGTGFCPQHVLARVLHHVSFWGRHKI